MMVELLLSSSQSATGSGTGGEEWVSMPSEVLPEEVMNRLARPKRSGMSLSTPELSLFHYRTIVPRIEVGVCDYSQYCL